MNRMLKTLAVAALFVFCVTPSADTAFQSFAPQSAWTSLPTCSASNNGRMFLVTDVGDQDFLTSCDGTRWTTPGVITFTAAPNLASQSQTAEQILAVVDIPPNIVGPNGFIVANPQWLYTSASGKIERVNIGGSGTVGTSAPTGGCVFAVESIGATTLHTMKSYRIHGFAATNAQKGLDNANAEFASPFTGAAAVTCSVDTTAAWKLFFTVSKSSAGDPATLEWYQVQVFYGP